MPIVTREEIVMELSRTAKVKKNVTAAFLLQILKISLAFLNRIIFVRIMGAVFLGINGLFGNILSILSVADLGMHTVMMYSLYRPLAEKNYTKVSAYMNLFNKAYAVIAIVVGFLGIAIMPFLKYIVNLPEDIDNIYIYYLLMLANVVISYLFVYRTTLLNADQKSYILDRIDMIVQIVLFIIQISILALTKNFVLYLTANVAATLIANVAKTRIVGKKYGNLLNKQTKLEKKERVKLVDDMKSMFLYKIGGVIQSNTDNILTSIFVGTLVVGYYSNYTMIVLAITHLVTMVFNSLKASVGNYNVEKNIAEQRKMFFNFEDYNYILIGFCSICFYVLIPDFITLFFGQEYLLSASALAFIVLNFYTANIRQNLWVYRETTGIFSKVKYTTLVTSILNIVLSIIGGELFGITGIIAATVIARLLYNWWKEPTILFRDYFKDSPKKYLVMYATRVMYVAMISFALSRVFSYIIIGESIVLYGIKVLATIVLALLLLLLPIAKNESIKLLKQKTIRRKRGLC